MREPDALDGARILAVALLATAALGLAAGAGLPKGALGPLIQLVFLASPLLYARWAGLRPLAQSGLGVPPWRSLAWVVAASAASLWILKGLHDGQLWAFRELGLEETTRGEAERIQRGVDGVRSRLGPWGLALFVVFPPLCEEMLFRGLMFRGLVRGAGVFRALLWTSLLFAAMHQSVAQLLLMTFLGFYFGTVVHLTGSLWAGMLAHAINNGAVLLMQERFGAEGAAAIPVPPWMFAFAVLVFAGALASLAYGRGGGRGEGAGASR